MPKCSKTKSKSSSWWCKLTLIGLLAEPFAFRILEDGFLEVVTFFVTGAEYRHVLRSALPKQSCTLKSLACRRCRV